MSTTAIVLAAATAASLAPGVYAFGTNRLDVVARPNGDRAIAIYAERELDHHNGFIAGTLPAGRSTFIVTMPQDERCKIAVTASANGVTLAQDGAFGTCGFGYGVLADGRYTRIPHANASLKDPRG